MMTESRKQFEEWATSEMLDVTKYINTDVYCMPDTYQLWQAWQEAWQASRAAVVVKLPSFFSDRYETELCFTNELEESLDDAGVSYEQY